MVSMPRDLAISICSNRLLDIDVISESLLRGGGVIIHLYAELNCFDYYRNRYNIISNEPESSPGLVFGMKNRDSSFIIFTKVKNYF